MINKEYFNQVNLLVQILPEIAKEDCFALIGGTAINLFYNNLPRLSVDIDFTYNQHLETLGYLIKKIQIELQRDYKEILLDFVSLNLDLSSIGILNIEKLPAIQWKLQNLTKLKSKNTDKFNEEYSKLKQVLTK